MSHGFSFDSTLMAGAGIFGNDVRAGSYVSLEYMRSKGSFTTETEEKGSSGQVENLNEKTLMASGLPKPVIRAYGFNWAFGTWKRELTTKSGDYTPFFGYRVWNVKMPPQPPISQELLCMLICLCTREAVPVSDNRADLLYLQSSSYIPEADLRMM